MHAAGSVALDVFGCALGRVSRPEVGVVTAEDLDPLLAGIVEILGHEVGDVVVAASGHADVH